MAAIPDDGEAGPDILFEALARCAARAPNFQPDVMAALQARSHHPAAAAGLVRLLLAQVHKEPPLEEPFPGEVKRQQHRETLNPALLDHLQPLIPDSQRQLAALLDAGVNDDIWNDDYHGVLVLAARRQVQAVTDSDHLLIALLRRLQQAVVERGWPSHRIALAAVAACAEEMPAALQRAAPQAISVPLEALLVQATTNAHSFNSRRFALTALSHLRTVTPAVVPALLAGCQDTESVQRDAIAAAGRFQQIDGPPEEMLSLLVPALTGESIQTAYAVTKLLGALGTSAAGEAAGLRDAIITALVDALDREGRQRTVTADDDPKKLADIYYEVLLQVAGVPA